MNIALSVLVVKVVATREVRVKVTHMLQKLDWTPLSEGRARAKATLFIKHIIILLAYLLDS